jgi:hypothetical protein
MGFFTGRTGSVVFTGTDGIARKVAKVRDWSLDTTVELLSTNVIDSHVNTFTAGVKGASGSATLLYYRLGSSGEIAAYSEFSEVIANIVKIGAVEDTTDLIRLELAVGTTPNDKIVFNCFVTQAQIAASTGELSVVPIQFTVEGDFIQVPTALAR